MKVTMTIEQVDTRPSPLRHPRKIAMIEFVEGVEWQEIEDFKSQVEALRVPYESEEIKWRLS